MLLNLSLFTVITDKSRSSPSSFLVTQSSSESLPLSFPLIIRLDSNLQHLSYNTAPNSANKRHICRHALFHSLFIKHLQHLHHKCNLAMSPSDPLYPLVLIIPIPS